MSQSNAGIREVERGGTLDIERIQRFSNLSINNFDCILVYREHLRIIPHTQSAEDRSTRIVEERVVIYKSTCCHRYDRTSLAYHCRQTYTMMRYGVF